MPDDHDELLRKTYNIALSNNKMLRSMKRAAFWGTIFKLVFYAVVLGVPLYLSLTVLQPLLGSFLDTYAQIQQTGAQIQNTTNALPLQQVQDLLNKIPREVSK